MYLSNPKPRHTTGSAGRDGAGQSGRGGAGRRRAGHAIGWFVRPGENQPSCLPGIGRQLSWTSVREHEQKKSHVTHWRNLSNPKPGHNTGGSRWGGTRRDGGAGRGRAAQDADGSVRPGSNGSLYPPDNRRQPSLLSEPLEARTSEIPC